MLVSIKQQIINVDYIIRAEWAKLHAGDETDTLIIQLNIGSDAGEHATPYTMYFEEDEESRGLWEYLKQQCSWPIV